MKATINPMVPKVPPINNGDTPGGHVILSVQTMSIKTSKPPNIILKLSESMSTKIVSPKITLEACLTAWLRRPKAATAESDRAVCGRARPALTTGLAAQYLI